MYNHNTLYKNCQIVQPQKINKETKQTWEACKCFIKKFSLVIFRLLLLFSIYTFFFFKSHFKFTFLSEKSQLHPPPPQKIIIIV